MHKKIMITGCSGIGKTTLAKYVSEEFGIPFISNSYSDLVPSTKDEKHQNMIQKSVEEIRAQDYQVVNLRHKLSKENPSFVTDRCYIDSMAYWIQKLSHRVPECDTTDFLGLCQTLLPQDCDAIIFIPYTHNYLDNWKMEDNGKRVLSGWYQAQITAIINYLLVEQFKTIVDHGRAKRMMNNPESNIPETSNKEFYTFSIELLGRDIPLLVLSEIDLESRKQITNAFIRSL